MYEAKATCPNDVLAEVNPHAANVNNDISNNIRAAFNGVEQLDIWETNTK